MSTAASLPASVRPGQDRLVIAAMLISTFMAAVEVTVISTAMPTIIDRLGGFNLFSWAFGIYVLGQAVTTPLYGRLADAYGRKPVYIFSTLLFLAGSLLCGCAWSMGSLILFRAVQGIGGGGLVPLSITIIGDVCKPDERPRMLGYVSGIWGIAAVVGPLLGAFLVGSLGWPFVFWLNLPIGVLVLAMVLRFLHETPVQEAHAPINVASAALLVAGAGSIMVALVQGKDLGLGEVLACVGFGILMLAGLAWHERGNPQPLLATNLMRRPIIAASAVSALVCGALLIETTAFFPTWVEGVMGGTPLRAGFVLGVLTVSWTVANMGMGRVMKRFSSRAIALVGAIALVLGYVGLLALRPGQWPYWLDILSVLIGAGLGLSSLVFQVAVQAGVESRDRGRATALFFFARLIGQTLGASAFGGLLNASLSASGVDQHGIGNLVGDARRDLPVAEVERLTTALAAGLHDVYILAAILAVAALIVAWCVPRRHPT